MLEPTDVSAYFTNFEHSSCRRVWLWLSFSLVNFGNVENGKILPEKVEPCEAVVIYV